MEERKHGEVTEQDCLAFASKHLQRELSPEEKKGLHALIEEHGPADVHGYILQAVSDYEGCGDPSLNHYLKIVGGGITLPEWINAQMEADDEGWIGE